MRFSNIALPAVFSAFIAQAIGAETITVTDLTVRDIGKLKAENEINPETFPQVPIKANFTFFNRLRNLRNGIHHPTR